MISKLDIKRIYEKELKYEKIAVIGIGSIGGYFIHYLSVIQKSLNTIILVDPDRVTQKNLRNSIFEAKDIGNLKTTAVKEKIKLTNPNISVIEINTYFNEKTIDPVIDNCDLIFDCRDFIYSRYGKIDARIYISEYYLIIDCNRIAIKKYNYRGLYFRPITKYQIITSAIFAAKLVSDYNRFSQILKKQQIEIFDITCFNNFESADGEINLDVIFDSCTDINISNLSQEFPTILKINEKSNISVFLYNSLFYTNNIVIPKKSIVYISELDKILKNMVIDDYKNHIIAEINKKENYMVLIPEDGGA